jgi:predicted HTH transcriptional regulator
MTIRKDERYLRGLVQEFCKYTHEVEWVEFKVNNHKPEEIGQYISALSNAAALNGKTHGYLIWGIEDIGHAIVGTAFSPSGEKIGNEPLENWLLHHLTPKIHFHFYEIAVDEKALVILEIERAFRHPVRFKTGEFIRVGSVKKPLKDAPDRERDLWRVFDQIPFEEGIAAERVEGAEVLRLLDYSVYFDLLATPLPSNRDGILKTLASDNLIRTSDAGGYDITNLGAILLAKKLSDFRKLNRKKLRIIRYHGTGRTEAEREIEIEKGYGNGFSEITTQIKSLLPSNEIIGEALRKTVLMYPEIAVRELVANALIHQDFYATGTNPMVEIFSNRIEFTNPGEPLVDTRRFVDTPPTSRNEVLASMMRRFNPCEERGSGIDKVITQVELYQLPAPLFEVPPGFTRTVLFAPRPLSEMNREDRIRAIYQHACLRYMNHQTLVNSSVRERFRLEPKSRSSASRYIKDALDAGMIKLVDPAAVDRQKEYVPYWV